MPVLEILSIVRRFWYVIPLVGLTFALLFMRASLAHKDTELTVANAHAVDLTKANADAKLQLDKLAANRIDNDAIASAVAAKVGVNTVRETNTRTIIERAGQNDPKVSTWLREPVPSSVRGALSADRPNAVAR